VYLNKFEILQEINKFLDTYDLSKLDQEYTKNLKKFIKINEIEAAMNSPNKGNPRI
jgi:hypothetical protein